MSKQMTKSAAYQAGCDDGNIQGYITNPKSGADCFIRRPELQEGDRKDYMRGFSDGYSATRRFMEKF